MSLRFILFVVFVSSFAASRASAGDFAERKLVHGGENRYWLEYAPESCKASDCALVLAFHPQAGTASRLEKSAGFLEIAKKNGFVLIYPNGLGKKWNDGRVEVAKGVDDVGFVDKLIAQAKRSYRIDDKRIFAVGMANGAMFSNRLACERSKIFAAIGTVAGLVSEPTALACNPSSPVSVIAFMGTKDNVVPFAGGMVKGSFGFRKLGKVLSMEESSKLWREKNGCQGMVERVGVIDAIKEDGTSLVSAKYTGCNGGSEVFFWTIQGGGHSWPKREESSWFRGRNVSREVAATEAIWKFFAEHPKK